MTSKQNTAPKTAASLAKALQKNQQATAAVEEVAEELAVVHSVLTAELKNVAAKGDLDSAVARTKTLEEKLSDTADKMDEVNRAIADQHSSIEHLLNAK
jgi:predicted transcriptional regulator